MGRLQELRSDFYTRQPYGKLLGVKLGALRRGYAVVTVLARRKLLVKEGMVQGGATTSIADFAGVYAAMSLLPAGHTPAGVITIHFHRPIKRGEIIKAVAQVKNESRGSILITVDVFGSSDKKLRAYATISFAKPRT